MGYADNATYKDQYPYFGRRNPYLKTGEMPSLKVEDDINDSIKENSERANVEIEGGEIVLQPDLSALFKAKGKKHKSGGMDVYLKPESFVFSDDKTLSVKEKELETFELKGAKKWRKNTPAQVLKKNIDIEHYNTLVSNLDNPNKDDLTKKSSAMMLEKYIETLGNVAYLQENKKDFPDGLPAFSQGTAPVFAPGMKENIDEQKQYARYGGSIGNPYKQMAVGGINSVYDPECPCGRLPNGKCNPDCPDEAYRGMFPKAKPVGIGSVPEDYQHLYEDRTSGRNLYGRFSNRQASGPKMTNEQWKEFLKNESPAHRAKRRAQMTQEDYLYTEMPKVNVDMGDGTNVPLPQVRIPKPNVTPSTPTINPNGVNVTPQSRKNIDIDFTPWQRVSQGWNALNYATLKRYMPMRSHLNGTDIDPALLNPEQAVADMRTGFNAQLDSLGSLNPILRNAQAASSYGQYLQQAPGVRSQFDNQNAAIKNQFRMFNTQRRDDRNVRNMINDATYQMQSVEGQKHFDDARTFAANNWMNNILRDVETNQTLAYNLATQNNPAYGFDFKHGNWYRNPKSVLDVNTDTKSDFYTNMAQTLMQKIQSGKELTKPEVDFFKALSIGKIPFTPGIKKKGGYTKGNPYR